MTLLENFVKLHLLEISDVALQNQTSLIEKVYMYEYMLHVIEALVKQGIQAGKQESFASKKRRADITIKLESALDKCLDAFYDAVENHHLINAGVGNHMPGLLDPNDYVPSVVTIVRHFKYGYLGDDEESTDYVIQHPDYRLSGIKSKSGIEKDVKILRLEEIS